jgi:hypothetical protein
MSESVRATLLAFEEELLSSQVRASEARLNEMLADEFVEFGSSGRIYDKPSIIRELGESGLVADFEIGDFRLVMSGEDAAFVTYHCGVKSDSGEVIRKSIRSSLWRLADDRWQLIFHQGTKTE